MKTLIWIAMLTFLGYAVFQYLGKAGPAATGNAGVANQVLEQP